MPLVPRITSYWLQNHELESVKAIAEDRIQLVLYKLIVLVNQFNTRLLVCFIKYLSYFDENENELPHEYT